MTLASPAVFPFTGETSSITTAVTTTLEGNSGASPKSTGNKRNTVHIPSYGVSADPNVKVYSSHATQQTNHNYNFSTTGQKFAPSNVHNLGQYDDQWTSDIYDMRSWYDGYCHTFDPRETQRRSLGSKLSFYLGHRELLNNDKNAMFKQFTVVYILLEN